MQRQPWGNEDLNLWSKNIATAQRLLTEPKDIAIIMGGRTGGDAYASEAELLAKEIGRKLRDHIVLEDRSTNTFENLVNVCNKYVDQHSSLQRRKFNLVGAPYHLQRMNLLAGLFGIPVANLFSSDEVLRIFAQRRNDDAQLLEIEQRLDVNADGRTPVSAADIPVSVGYYADKLGTEKKSVGERREEEDIWTRAIFQLPEYWFGYMGQIQSDRRLALMLGRAETIFPEQLITFGINVDSDSPDQIRESLKGMVRVMPKDYQPEKERIARERGISTDEVDVMQTWKEEHRTIGWPKEVQQRFERFLKPSEQTEPLA